MAVVKDLVNDESVVEAELLESHLLETEGKALASMTPKEASKDCRLTLRALKTGPLSLERHSKVPLAVKSQE